MAGVFTLMVTLTIIGVLLVESQGFFKEVSLKEFFTATEWSPLFTTKRFGISPLICGTLLITAIALLVAGPIGILTAIWISEYTGGRFREIVKPVLEILAAVPSVVYGYFALLTLTPFLQRFIPDLAGFNALSPGLVMGIMIIPLVSSLSEDSVRAVPRDIREGAYALGARKYQVILRVIIPAAFPGVMASLVLAIARAIGETMIVAIAAGLQPRLTLNPLVPVETMTAYIVQVTQGDIPHGTLEYRTIFVVGLTLFLMTFLVNTISFLMTRKMREIYE